MYPGDEILMVYDEYPYEAQKPIVIDPETALLWVKLKIAATEKNWKSLDPKYTSKLQKLCQLPMRRMPLLNNHSPRQISDCFKKNFVKYMNNTCQMPWSCHIQQWTEEFGIKGKPSQNCSNEDIFNNYQEHFGVGFNIIMGENAPCKGLEVSYPL